MAFDRMLTAVHQLHDDRGFRLSGGEDPLWRVALLAEEVGEIAAAVTKGGDLAAEHADLLIVLLGNCIALDIDLEKAFWAKMQALNTRPTVSRLGRTRIGKMAHDGLQE